MALQRQNFRSARAATSRQTGATAAKSVGTVVFPRVSALPASTSLLRSLPCSTTSIAHRSMGYGKSRIAVRATNNDGDAQAPPGVMDTLWGQKEQVQKYPTLTKDEGEVDVVVIGAGLGGLLTAYALATKGKSVAVVEARTRGSGQSGKTSAHLMQWHDDFYSHLEKKWGKKDTQLITDSMLGSIAWLEKIVKNENIDCDFMRLPGYLIPPAITPDATIAQAQSKLLDEELASCQRLGMKDVEKVDLSEKGQLAGSVKEALVFPRCGDWHILKFINGLAEVLTEKYKVKLFEGSKVMRKDVGTDGQVPVEAGGSIKAREAVVIATNSPINHNVAVHSRQEPYRSYMLACKVEKGSVERAQWWTAEEIYKYIRLQSLDDKHDLLMIGGSDHIAGQDPSKYKDNWKELEMFLRARFPQAGEVTHRWSGQVYEPADELGLYGLDPANPMNWPDAPARVAKAAVDVVEGVAEGKGLPDNFDAPVKRYIITGDSGQGMTGCAIGALVISDLIVGQTNPWADLYSPSRLAQLPKPSTVSGLFSETEMLAKGLGSAVILRNLDDASRLVAPRDAMPELKAGQGTVVQEGTSKIAMYRDPETGAVSKHSAICTHLGCLISWNPNQGAWNCCCHGSVFDTKGRVTNGPACADLEEFPDAEEGVPAESKAHEVNVRA